MRALLPSPGSWGAGLAFSEEKRLQGRTENERWGSPALAGTERTGSGRAQRLRASVSPFSSRGPPTLQDTRGRCALWGRPPSTLQPVACPAPASPSNAPRSAALIGGRRRRRHFQTAGSPLLVLPPPLTGGRKRCGLGPVPAFPGAVCHHGGRARGPEAPSAEKGQGQRRGRRQPLAPGGRHRRCGLLDRLLQPVGAAIPPRPPRQSGAGAPPVARGSPWVLSGPAKGGSHRSPVLYGEASPQPSRDSAPSGLVSGKPGRAVGGSLSRLSYKGDALPPAVRDPPPAL